MDYTSLFNQMKSRLSSVNATILKEDKELNFTANERNYYFGESGFSIPTDLFQLYTEFNGLEFLWEFEKDGEIFNGFFSIENFYDLYYNSNEGKLWQDWYDEEDIVEMKKHRIFETIHGSDYYITIKFEENDQYKLFYVPEGAVSFRGSNSIAEIPLKIEQYVKMTTSCFGIYSLRHHLHKEEFYKNPFDVVPELKTLEKLFPDFEFPNLII